MFTDQKLNQSEEKSYGNNLLRPPCGYAGNGEVFQDNFVNSSEYAVL